MSTRNIDPDAFVMKNSPRMRETARTIAKRDTVRRLAQSNPTLSPADIAKKTWAGDLTVLDNLDYVSFEGDARGIANARPFFAYVEQVKTWINESEATNDEHD